MSVDLANADAWRERGNALKASGEVAEAITAFQRAQELGAGPSVSNEILYLLHLHPNCDPAMLREKHLEWNRKFAAPLAAQIQPHRNDPSPDRPLRIGYVSADFRQHVLAYSLEPLLREHDRQQFQIFCYSNVRNPDAVTQAVVDSVDVFRDIWRLNDRDAAEVIRSDRIDILVDLSLHTPDNRLSIFALKPAPVQVTFLAYCSTSGMAAMDYRFSDPYLDSPEIDLNCYTERTIRLTRTYWCYLPRPSVPDVSVSPVHRNGFVTFGCLNNFLKVSNAALDLWAQILQQARNSRLILHCPEGRRRGQILERFVDHEIAGERIDMIDRQIWENYLATYNRIDIALDPFPFGGGITTCEALFMGVPVVTLSGQTAVGRGGRSILSNIELPDLIADSKEQYRQIALDWAKWIQLRPQLRQLMLRSPLMDAQQYARDVEAAYRQMWHAWCATHQ